MSTSSTTTIVNLDRADLLTRLAELAARFDRLARTFDAAGGTWSQIIGAEIRRDAAQLDFTRVALASGVLGIDVADAIATAAAGRLTLIETAA